MNEARGPFADFFGRLWRQKPLGIASGIVILILILLAIFADVLAPYPFDQLNLADRLQGSSTRHLLGTDQLGRDLLSRLLFGARISLVVGLVATTLNVVVATLIGGTSGFLGGKLDLAVQRFVDAWMAFPGLLLLLTIMSIAGQGLPQIIVVLGIAGGVGGSRVVRGAVVATKGNDYFLAAKALGAPTTQILVRHVLPNIVAPLIIIFSINVGGVILAEASLSFLGFGLPIQVPSWGGMLSREGRRFMEQAPWLALWPGLCLTIVVYSFNMLGDAMRDLLDPRLRGGGGQPRRRRRHRVGAHRDRRCWGRRFWPIDYPKSPLESCRNPRRLLGRAHVGVDVGGPLASPRRRWTGTRPCGSGLGSEKGRASGVLDGYLQQRHRRHVLPESRVLVHRPCDFR